MARASRAQGGATKLVALKVVEPGYPLRGKLRLADEPGAPESVVQAIPAAGEAWVDAGVLDAIGLKIGDTLLLGDAQLRLAKIIVNEPDRGAGFMSFSPRIMINRVDVDVHRPDSTRQPPDLPHGRGGRRPTGARAL